MFYGHFNMERHYICRYFTPIDSDNYVENNEHYFLHCKLFVNKRNVMLNNIRDLGLDTSINTIVYGNSDSAYNHVSCSDR